MRTGSRLWMIGERRECWPRADTDCRFRFLALPLDRGRAKAESGGSPEERASATPLPNSPASARPLPPEAISCYGPGRWSLASALGLCDPPTREALDPRCGPVTRRPFPPRAQPESSEDLGFEKC